MNHEKRGGKGPNVVFSVQLQQQPWNIEKHTTFLIHLSILPLNQSKISIHHLYTNLLMATEGYWKKCFHKVFCS